MKDEKDIKWYEEHEAKYQNVPDSKLSFATWLSRQERYDQMYGQNSRVAITDPGCVLGGVQLAAYVAAAPVALLCVILAIPGAAAVLMMTKLVPGEERHDVGDAYKTAWKCLFGFFVALALVVYGMHYLLAASGPDYRAEQDLIQLLFTIALSYSQTARQFFEANTLLADRYASLDQFQSLSDVVAIVFMLLLPSIATFAIIFRRRTKSSRGWFVRWLSALATTSVTVAVSLLCVDTVLGLASKRIVAIALSR